MLTGENPFGSAELSTISFAFAFAIFAAVYSVGHISGCHINPAVTIALLATRKIDTNTAIGYIGAQLVGALIGAGLTSIILTGNDPVALGLGAVDVNANAGIGIGFAAEVIGTAILVFTVFGAAVDGRAPAGFAGIVIGFIVFGIIILVGPITGAALNPARQMRSEAVAELYRWRWPFRALRLLGIGLIAVLAAPAPVMSAALFVYPVAMVLGMAGLESGARLIEFFVTFLAFAFAPAALPSWIPRLALLLCTAALIVPGRRRVAGALAIAAVSPIDGQLVVDLARIADRRQRGDRAGDRNGVALAEGQCHHRHARPGGSEPPLRGAAGPRTWASRDFASCSWWSTISTPIATWSSVWCAIRIAAHCFRRRAARRRGAPKHMTCRAACRRLPPTSWPPR